MASQLSSLGCSCSSLRKLIELKCDLELRCSHQRTPLYLSAARAKRRGEELETYGAEEVKTFWDPNWLMPLLKRRFKQHLQTAKNHKTNLIKAIPLFTFFRKVPSFQLLKSTPNTTPNPAPSQPQGPARQRPNRAVALGAPGAAGRRGRQRRDALLRGRQAVGPATKEASTYDFMTFYDSLFKKRKA